MNAIPDPVPAPHRGSAVLMERSIEPLQHSAEASRHARDIFHTSATPIVLARRSAL